MEHVFTESMFLVGFVIFIAAILVLDMLVIDRKAHVVSIKELTQENISYTSDQGKTYDFNTADNSTNLGQIALHRRP